MLPVPLRTLLHLDRVKTLPLQASAEARSGHWAVRGRKEMLALATIMKIRVDHFQDRVLIKAIMWKRRVSRSTVRKAVREDPEAFVSASERQPKPGRWITELERMINAVDFISRSGQIVAPRRRASAGEAGEKAAIKEGRPVR